jgi:uncharacterized protein YjiS (DUF1127 family)
MPSNGRAWRLRRGFITGAHDCSCSRTAVAPVHRIAVETGWQRRETAVQWRPGAMTPVALPGYAVMDDLLRGGSVVLLYFVALRGSRRPRREAAAQPIDGVVATLRRWRQRARARRELAGLDDYLLHDIGLSRSQAQYESGKRFWQA